MDIARPDFARKKKIRLTIYTAAALVVLPVITIGVSRLKPAAPVVERSTIWLDTVKRGEMLREVRGLGTLVPVDIRWIPAQTSARVDKILLQSGVPVMFGLLTCESLEQAIHRSGGNVGNKGVECAEAALEMASLLRKLPK